MFQFREVDYMHYSLFLCGNNWAKGMWRWPTTAPTTGSHRKESSHSCSQATEIRDLFFAYVLQTFSYREARAEVLRNPSRDESTLSRKAGENTKACRVDGSGGRTGQTPETPEATPATPATPQASPEKPTIPSLPPPRAPFIVLHTSTSPGN